MTFQDRCLAAFRVETSSLNKGKESPMGVIYTVAPKAVDKIVAAMMKQYHGPLESAGVTVGCLFASAPTDENGEKTGPAVKLHGYQCAAVVRIVGIKDRAKGISDVEIVIDGDRWDEWSDEEKDALIDHELEHVELVTDGEGAAKRDDLDRPKLRLRKHDRQFGWFDSIARRHGRHSFEVQQATEFAKDHGQQYMLDFMGKPAAKDGQRVKDEKKTRLYVDGKPRDMPASEVGEFIVKDIEKRFGRQRAAAEGK